MDNIARKNKTIAFFAFGRFQPPTVGHGLLIKSVEKAAIEGNGDAYIFVSSTLNKLKKTVTEKLESATGFKNPLDVQTKIDVLKKMYPSNNIKYVNTETCKCNNPFLAISALLEKGYSHLYLFVGEDRFKEMGPKFRNNPDVTLIYAGDRNETGNSVKSMSGTKMRKAAINRNLNTFKKGVVTNSFSHMDAADLMQKVRRGVGLTGGRYTRRKRRLQD